MPPTEIAHIMGVPVEETLEAFAPVAVVSLAALSATLRGRWRRARLRLVRRSGRSSSP